MSAMCAATSVPMGYDPGFPFDSSLEEDLLSQYFDFDQGMTQTYPVFEDEANCWSPDSPTSSRGDVAKLSPGSDHRQAPAASQGSASLSPAGPIYTPTSTLLEFEEDITAETAGFENASTSPESNRYLSDDYVHVDGLGDEMSNSGSGMASQPPRTLGVTSSPQLRLGSTQQQSVPASNPTLLQPQWQRLSTSPSNASMEDSFMPYTSSADLGMSTVSWTESDLLSDGSGFSSSFPDQAYGTSFSMPNHSSLHTLPSASNGTSFGPLQTVAVQGPASTINPFLHSGVGTPSHHAGTYIPHQQKEASATHPTFVRHNVASARLPSNAFLQQQRPPQMMPFREPRYSQAPQVNTAVSQANSPITNVASSPPIKTQQRSHLDYKSSSKLSSLGARRRPQADSSSCPSQPTALQASRKLVKREPGQSATGPIRSSQADRVKRGGRQRNTHLTTETRQKSHEMRKKGACWRCAMQRDQCDHGEPCNRCVNRAAKGQIQYFECDRSKLPDFVYEFLPPKASMTVHHAKQSIEDSVKSEVRYWDKEHQLDLYLTTYYGEPLVWKCHEFVPNSNEYISQRQYFRNASGQEVGHMNYSPPFGLLKIDTSDDHHVNAYLERLMHPKYLWELPWCFYEEENSFEPNEVQASLLDAVCKLYQSTTDAGLQALLKDIIRMLIITHIMGRTLCIVDSNLPTVISSIRHTVPPAQYSRWTSPKMANRQIKFFFSVLRAQIYEKILKWQQQTFHTGGKKESTWVHSFCVMLGFAMVLEEVQCLIQLQADTAVARGDMTYEDATRQAENAFHRIDERYKLLIGLFQCKYRDKTWGENGSFGPHTPQLSEQGQVHFLGVVRNILINNQQHFRHRENVPFGGHTEYTTRQTARFLLPFLSLQGYRA